MKIAIAVDSHVASTLPLAKELAERGNDVDYYIFCTGSIDHVEGTDIDFASSAPGIKKIPASAYPALKGYLGEGVTIYAIVLPRPFASLFAVRSVMKVFRQIAAWHVGTKIRSCKYDVVNLVGRHLNEEFIPIIRRNKQNVFLSLHEVCNHYTRDFSRAPRLLSYVFENRIRIILHSDGTLADLKSYKDACDECASVIHFGLFTSYSIFSSFKRMNLPEEYFLFFGRITPYKGVRVFIDAAEKAAGRLPSDVKFVIAGNGRDDSLDGIADNPRFVLINRFLSNEEVAELISRSRAVVCPYLTMSQSGIPQTAYVFGKPVIASDLPGFREVMNDDSPYLCPVGNADAFAEAMVLVNNSNSGDFELLPPEFSWKYIVDQYEALFKS